VRLGWAGWLPPGEIGQAMVIAAGTVLTSALAGLLAMGGVGCFERD
jgi:hypothetical protein